MTMFSRRHRSSTASPHVIHLPLALVLLASTSASLFHGCTCGEEEIPCNNNLDCPLRAQVCVDGLCVTGVDAGMTDARMTDARMTDTGLPDTGLPDSATPSSWWDQGWQYRRKLTFDNSGQAEDLADFTVLVRLDCTRVNFGRLQDAAEDLRFVDDDDATPLAYEIEHLNEVSGSYVWVRVPLIPSASNDDHIWMYYGDESASDGQDPAGTWDSRYRVVSHMGGFFVDSTGQTPSAFWNGILAGPGLIGPATQFNGSDSYIFLPERVGLTDLFALEPGPSSDLDGATISAWIYKTGPGGRDLPRLADKSSDTRGGDGWAFAAPNEASWGQLRGADRQGAHLQGQA